MTIPFEDEEDPLQKKVVVLVLLWFVCVYQCCRSWNHQCVQVETSGSQRKVEQVGQTPAMGRKIRQRPGGHMLHAWF